jgi:hypothetical protein
MARSAKSRREPSLVETLIDYDLVSEVYDLYTRESP